MRHPSLEVPIRCILGVLPFGFPAPMMARFLLGAAAEAVDSPGAVDLAKRSRFRRVICHGDWFANPPLGRLALGAVGVGVARPVPHVDSSRSGWHPNTAH